MRAPTLLASSWAMKTRRALFLRLALTAPGDAAATMDAAVRRD